MALNEFGAGFKIYAKDNASGVFGRVGKSFSGMTRRVSDSSSKMQSSLQRIGKGASMAVGSIAGVGFPLASAIRESMGLNKALAEVATLTDEANFPLEKMRELTKGLAAEYGGKAALQAKALYQTISAGYGDVEEAAKMMNTANKLAVGGVTEVETAIDGLTNVMNTYKKDNLAAADVSDTMFIAMREGKTTIGELASQIGRAAPGAESLGIKFDELFAAISAITSKGIDTASTVSGLAGAMANIAKPTSDAKKEAARLGIEFSAAGLRAKGLKGFLDSITQSAKYNEDTMINLFGSIEAFKVMTALSANESEKFNDVLAKMGQRAGATDVAVAKMRDTFSFQWARFNAIFDNLKTSVGNVAEGLFGPLLKHVNNAMDAFNKFFDSIPEGVKKGLVGFAAALAGIGASIGSVVALVGVVGMLGTSISGIAIGLGALLLLSGPLMLMFGGVAVAVYSVYRAFKKNTDGITMSWQDMLKKLSLAWSGMQAIWKGEPLGDELVSQLTKAENSGVAKFLIGFETFTLKVKRFWKGLMEGFEAGVDSLSQSGSMKRLLDTVNSIFAVFSGDPAKVSKEELDAMGLKGEDAGRRLAQLGENALDALNNIVDLGKSFGAFISQLSAEDVAATVDTITGAFSGMWEVLKGIAVTFDVIYRVVRTVFEAVNFIASALTDFTALGWPLKLLAGDDLFDAQYTRKSMQNFGDIWSGELGFDTPKKRTQAAPVVPEAGTGITWSRETGTVQGIKSARSDLMEWMSASTEDWRSAHPDRYAFQEASGAEQQQWINELDRLERLIKEMSSRPIEVKIDQEKVALAVQNSDTVNGTRDL